MKTYAIARNTFSESIRQPVVYLLNIVGAALILLSFAFTLFTFSEENTAKMIKDMGLATITLCALLVALFTSSSVIADEIEKKTALTVLCKPVSRLQFLLGKYFGILLLVACVIVAQLTVFIAALWFLEHKVNFILAGAAIFSFLQVGILTAISVAISTRFPLVVNVSVCFVLYVVGHANSYIMGTLEQGGASMRTCAQVLTAILPNLECLDFAPATAAGVHISISCLAFGILYAVSYTVAVLALGFIALERRELM